MTRWFGLHQCCAFHLLSVEGGREKKSLSEPAVFLSFIRYTFILSSADRTKNTMTVHSKESPKNMDRKSLMFWLWLMTTLMKHISYGSQLYYGNFFFVIFCPSNILQVYCTFLKWAIPYLSHQDLILHQDLYSSLQPVLQSLTKRFRNRHSCKWHKIINY